jgi:hypothetical protein
MNWFLNLATRNKLFLGFGLLALLLATIIGTAYTTIKAVRASQHNLYETDFANVADLLTFESNQNGARASQLTMMALTKRSAQERWLEDMKERARANDTILQRLLERNRQDSPSLHKLEELQATAQVRTILNDIQKATSGAVMATEQGSKAVAAGVKQSGDAGEAIRMLAENIAEAAQAAAQIAASSHQQLVGMDQVALAMDNIKQASTQNVAGTKQTETAAHSLHEVGQKLKQTVERYEV